jgi:hypothetical protein
MAPIIKLTKKIEIFFWTKVSEGLKVDQTKVYWSTNIDITKLASGVSCSYKCIIINYRSYVVSEFDKEE